MGKEKVYKIVWSPSAKLSLYGIFDFLATSQSEAVAQKVVGGILETVEDISIFPKKYQSEPILGDDFRYAIIWSYKILYHIVGSKILIKLVFHTSQSPSKLKKLIKK